MNIQNVPSATKQIPKNRPSPACGCTVGRSLLLLYNAGITRKWLTPPTVPIFVLGVAQMFSERSVCKVFSGTLCCFLSRLARITHSLERVYCRHIFQQLLMHIEETNSVGSLHGSDSFDSDTAVYCLLQ